MFTKYIIYNNKADILAYFTTDSHVEVVVSDQIYIKPRDRIITFKLVSKAPSRYYVISPSWSYRLFNVILDKGYSYFLYSFFLKFFRNRFVYNRVFDIFFSSDIHIDIVENTLNQKMHIKYCIPFNDNVKLNCPLLIIRTDVFSNLRTIIDAIANILNDFVIYFRMNYWIVVRNNSRISDIRRDNNRITVFMSK